MVTALTHLSEVYATRAGAAARWRDYEWPAGGPPASSMVVGYVGADVPVELLTAAGIVGVRLAGDPAVDTTPADTYLGRGVDPMARSVLTLLLSGAYGRLDRLVVSRDCEASLRLFYALRELRRVEPALGLPETYLVDLLHLPHRTTAHYNRARLVQFRERLETWTGRTILAADLAWAIEQHDEQRRLLAEVASLRHQIPVCVSGEQFLAVVGSGTAMPVTVHNGLLRQVLSEARELPDRDGPRVYLTGSSHDTPEVYRAIESLGTTIVGESHDWGDLLFHRQVGPRNLTALAERYQDNGPSAPRATTTERAQHTAAAARRCRADVLVGYVREGDQAPPWDYTAEREASGLPGTLLEHQRYGCIDFDGFRLPVGAQR